MMVFLVLTVIFLAVFLSIRNHWQKSVRFYRSLGAREIRPRFFSLPPFHPVGWLDLGDIRGEIYTEGPKGHHLLTLKIPTGVAGFLIFQKRNLWNGMFLEEIQEGIGAQYEDRAWVKRILNHRNAGEILQKLFREGGVESIRIANHGLKVSWKIQGHPGIREREKIERSLPLLKEFLGTLSEQPGSSDTEPMRNLVTLRIPVFATLILSSIGVLGGFYKYQPLCFLDILGAGYRILFFPALLYVFAAMMLTGGHHPRLALRVFVQSLVAWLLAIPFLSLFFLMFVNGKFDTSPPEFRDDRVVEKYISYNRGSKIHNIVLAKGPHTPWCPSFQVSENLYRQVQPGDRVEYAVKRGFLKVPWWHQKLRVVR